jgi:hypothetical protein
MSYRYLILLLALALPARVAFAGDTVLGESCDLKSVFEVTDKQGFLDFDASLRAALKNGDPSALSLLVKFPLGLQDADGSSLAITDAATLQSKFDLAFPQTVRDAILKLKPSDFWCNYVQAFYNSDGVQVNIEQVKVGEAKEFRVTSVDLIPSSNPLAKSDHQIRFVCHTQKYRILIDQTGAEKLRYRAWVKPSTFPDKPDMEIDTGAETVEGSDICGHSIWTFKNGKTQYQVSELGCTNGSEPKDSVGSVNITIGDKPIETLWCYQ